MINRILLLAFIKFLISGMLCAQSVFFTQSWVEFDGRINNNRNSGERTRVSDRGMSTHPDFSTRSEAHVNGLALMEITDTISQVLKAELICEMWGGHPKTSGKRFQINGGKTYSLPSDRTAEGNCEYLFPVISVEETELVTGINALQFACDRGEAFWGHFLMEEIALRCYYNEDSPNIRRSGLAGFKAQPETGETNSTELVEVWLQFNKSYSEQISSVHYLGYYKGYDWNGSGNDSQWHGYLFKRKWTGHIGSSTVPPYKVKWDTRVIPDQDKDMGIVAVVEFKNGIFCRTDVSKPLSFHPERPHVQLIYCTEMPVPFWSRDKQLKKAVIELNRHPSEIGEVFLLTRIWDGGAGTIREPFRMNRIPYHITEGNAPHDLVSRINKVDPSNLHYGSNEMELYSDTEHHGIEICLPGPALIVRYKR